MNRVLVSGLGNASDMGLCDACGLNFSWLAKYPSILIWCDEICLPQNALKSQKNATEDKTDLAINIFLELADSVNLIKPIDLSPLKEAGVGTAILEKATRDSVALLEHDSEVQKGSEGVPGEIMIHGRGYCQAIQSSIYTSIISADLLNASCLFSNYERAYLEKLYAVKERTYPELSMATIFNDVFSLYLPENLSLHNYAFTNESECKQCNKYDSCKSTYLSQTEKAIKKVLEWRNYDEIQRAKEELNKIIKKKNCITDNKSLEEIRRSYEDRQNCINKNIRSVFPKIERWTKLATLVATPLVITAAIYSENIPLVAAGAAIPQISKSLEAGVDYYKNKHNWVGFINQMSSGL